MGDFSFLHGLAVESLGSVVIYVGLLCVVANLITCTLPTRVGNVYIDWVLRLLNILSGNFARNRNADDSVVHSSLKVSEEEMKYLREKMAVIEKEKEAERVLGTSNRSARRSSRASNKPSKRKESDFTGRTKSDK